MVEAGFFKAIYDSLAGFPVLQAAVGALILIGGLRLMMKADKVKEAAAVTAGAPAPLPASDASQLHLQGGAAMLEMLRTIAECAKAAHQEAKRQTELLEKIERTAFEQAVQGQSHPH